MVGERPSWCTRCDITSGLFSRNRWVLVWVDKEFGEDVGVLGDRVW